ncbi:MAG: hypothetical protein LUD72_05490 [Bacteroidales bacterium]|nr:hypothetical protein [Bacteroidales bacterium]
MLRFDKDEMMKYFEPERTDESDCDGFDYIDYKYRHLLRDFDATGIGEFVPVLNKLFVQYERSKTHNLYEKIDYSEIYERLKLIYADPREAESFIFLYDFALDHLLDRYINIPILNKIFSHHFFEYEWEQHVDMNFEKNELSFYRDHFIHQIRNCYMILKYLDYSGCDVLPGGEPVSKSTETYYEKIESVLRERTSEISKYACAYVEQYVEYVKSKVTSFAQRSVLSSSANEEDKDESKEKNDEKKKVVMEKVLENVEGFSWNYLIRGSLIIAALFHDIGYPIRYTYKNIDSVSEYMSSIVPSDNIGFDRLNDLLEGSLLFTVTNKKEMRKRYDSLDHGALSAYMLLLQVYETGAIHSLNPVKKAMIELAAVIVYDHTLKYSSMGDSKDKYSDEIRERPSFRDNPLTYTLRFVDDLQEWDRLYFEITSGDDFVYCEKCRMPIVDIWDEFEIKGAFDLLQSMNENAPFKQNDIRRSGSEINKMLANAKAGTNMEEYFSLEYANDPLLKRICVCGCDNYKGDRKLPYYASAPRAKEALEGKIKGHLYIPGPIEDSSIFRSQRINYTMTCDDVVLLRDNHGDVFYLDYNPFSQLYLLTINQKSLSYRIGEIAKLNRQFDRQSDINIRMRTHITDNPMMLKMRVMGDFLYEVGAYMNIDPKIERSKYKRNMVYYDMVKNCVGSQTWETRFGQISKLMSALCRNGFLAYDYRVEKVAGESSVMTSDDYQAIRNALNIVFSKISESLIWPDGTSNLTIFRTNLVNTLKTYTGILIAALQASQGKDSDWVDLCKLKDNKYCQFGYIDDIQKSACGMIYRDCISQLYYQSKGDMEKYYELRGKHGEKERRKMFWDDADFVIGEEDMEYALSVVFQKKYYNPTIMKEEQQINTSKLNFFDIYSDMYLFMEMNRFTVDNRKRRHEAYTL